MQTSIFKLLILSYVFPIDPFKGLPLGIPYVADIVPARQMCTFLEAEELAAGARACGWYADGTRMVSRRYVNGTRYVTGT